MEKQRHIQKIIWTVGMTWVFFACSVCQVYAFFDTHPRTVEQLAYSLPPFALPVMILSPFLIGYWCYLLAKNLASFFLGSGAQSKPPREPEIKGEK